ncbi:MAG: hypothetical protein AAF752_14455, partial [Bacteroidota bacterium]
MSKRLLLACAVVLGVSAGVAQAQISGIGTFSLRPDAAANTADEDFVAVWQEQPNTGTPQPSQIYARRVDTSGGPDGDATLVSSGSNTNQRPALAYNPSTGQSLVVWTEIDVLGERQILAQRLNADIEKEGSVILVTGSGVRAFGADVAFDPGFDGYYVAWTAFNSSDGTFQVFGQRISEDGTLVGGSGQLSVTAAGATSASRPAVAFSEEADAAVAVWTQRTGSSTKAVGRLAVDGSPSGSEFDVSGTGPAIAHIDAEYNPVSTEVLVVWSDGTNVFGNRINNAGVPQGTFSITSS